MAGKNHPNAIIKVVEVPIGVEFEEPTGWILREVQNVDVDSGKFFGILVKILPDPKPPVEKNKKPVNLKKK